MTDAPRRTGQADTADAPAAPPCLDLIALQELQMIMEDEFALLLTTFVRDASARIQELEAARSDWTALRRAAHSFKGSSSNIGALALSEYCLNLELWCQQAEQSQLVIIEPDQQHQIDQFLAQIREALQTTHQALLKQFPDAF